MRNQAGMSLLEMMVVLVVVALMCGVGLLEAQSLLPGYRLRQAARDLTAELRMARRVAVRQNRSVEVVFDLAQQTWHRRGAPPGRCRMSERYGGTVRYGFGNACRSAAAGGGRLPSAAVTFGGNPRRVVFNGRGLSNPGTVYLCGRRGDACAVIVSTSGRIRLRRWHPQGWR